MIELMTLDLNGIITKYFYKLLLQNDMKCETLSSKIAVVLFFFL